MSIKVLKKLSVIMCAVICTLTFIRTDAFAAYSGTTTVTATKTIYFDSEHSVTVHAISEVDYGYDEGASGWIEDCNMEIQMGSNTVTPDTCRVESYGDFGKSSNIQRYYVYCYRFLAEYTCYINVHVHCDEWGDVSSWITYDNPKINK